MNTSINPNASLRTTSHARVKSLLGTQIQVLVSVFFEDSRE